MMQCNIDARGKAVRLGIGLALCAVGATLAVAHMLAIVPPAWTFGLGIGMVIVGAFGVFEGWAGWCVVRAMGFKTRV